MKNFVSKMLWPLFILLLFVFCGCANDNDDNNGSQTTTAKIGDYFPITENTKYVYEGMGNEYASYTVYNDYTEADKLQQRLNNGGTETVNIIQIFEGKLIKVFAESEIYYRENFLVKQDNDTEILLMEPLQKGKSWTLTDGRVRSITDTEASVSTPLGDYKAVEVTTESGNGKNIDYYAKDVGLVKSIFKEGETEISSSLAQIEKDVPLIQNINFYYPNINDEKIYYKNVAVNFYTNDVTREKLAQAYKGEPVANTGKVFSENTQINSLYLNDDGMVYLDLNKAFLQEMNAGAGYEAMILQSIANTFGQYYNAEKVILTIEGKPYESGHIALQEGEYLQVNYDNVIEGS
mgnify:CR=1 FL=1